MSFILDALKKSESERQRQTTPGIADVPQAPAKKPTRRWIWLLSLLLAVNTVVLVGVILRPEAEAPDSAANLQTPLPLPSADTPPDEAETFSDIVAEAKRNRVAPPPVATDPQPENDSLPQQETVAETPRKRSSSVTDGLMSFDDLRAAGILQIPELHLDIHVYSEEPAERFVFVNMSKYKEQGKLAEGPRVQEITPEGVVLEHSGTTFLLPRQ